MEAKKRRYMASNGGYSLVELIVTVLITGIVMLAVMGFLSSGLRHFRNVNSESLLQMESQMTELFITELIQESTDFRMAGTSDLPSGVTTALEIKKGTNYYILAQVGDELRFGTPTSGSTLKEKIANVQGQPRNKTFLADYVTSFSMISNADTFDEARSNAGFGFVGTSVEIEYQVDQKSYTSISLIKLQNVDRN